MVTFDNIDLVVHDGQSYYIEVVRYTRTTPFSVSHPIPKGGILGTGHILTIKYEGLPAKRKWRLYKGDELVAAGNTDKDGKYYDLPIDMPYLGKAKYRLELSADQDDPLPEKR